jgi:hypothetical protein
VLPSGSAAGSSYAVLVLGDIGSSAREAIAALNMLLTDPETKVREAVEMAINLILDKLPPLTEAEKDSRRPPTNLLNSSVGRLFNVGRG